MLIIIPSILIFFLIAAADSRKMRSTQVKKDLFRELYTEYRDAGHGNIFYLDRHDVNCGLHPMTFFKLERQGDNKIRYHYTCAKNERLTLPKQNEVEWKYTKWNDTGADAKKSNIFLDRHTMVCSTDKVIGKFSLERKKSKIRYQYTCLPYKHVCCKPFTTTLNSRGDQETFYLDRHAVGMEKSDHVAIESFKLETINGQIRYVYTMCQLYRDPLTEKKKGKSDKLERKSNASNNNNQNDSNNGDLNKCHI